VSEQKQTEFEATFKAGLAAAAPAIPPNGAVPIVIVPKDCAVEGLERYIGEPIRKRGTAAFAHESGFDAYLTKHKDADCALFVDMDAQTMTAVVNYHTGTAARWGDHRAVFAPPKDADWLIWMAHDDKPMSQIDFTQFIEDNLPAIVEPPSAELLEMVQHLEAHTAVKFKSANRIKDGAKALVYEETVQGGVGKGQIEIPDDIKLRMPVFRWGEPVDLIAKLRYRIAEGKLHLWYHLHRPQDAIDDAFKRLLDGVEVATSLKPMIGKAPGIDEMHGRK
jgi:uncharacterized protein YfdQ (DUF2303 family)